MTTATTNRLFTATRLSLTSTAVILDCLRRIPGAATRTVANEANLPDNATALRRLKALEAELLVRRHRYGGQRSAYWSLTDAGGRALEQGDSAASVATFHPVTLQVVNAWSGAMEWEPGLVLELDVPAAGLDQELEDVLWGAGWDPEDPALAAVSCADLAHAAERIGDHALELKILTALRSRGIRHGQPLATRTVTR